VSIYALVTESILAGDWKTKHINYTKEDESVFVMVTHADTWELKALRRVCWRDFTTKCSPAKEVTFLEGQHLRTRDDSDMGWHEVR
jgi:hypothetical protein